MVQLFNSIPLFIQVSQQYQRKSLLINVYSPKTPSLKLMVTTIILPVDARTVPSYGFPLFHSKLSPCTYTKQGNKFVSSSPVTETYDTPQIVLSNQSFVYRKLRITVSRYFCFTRIEIFVSGKTLLLKNRIVIFWLVFVANIFVAKLDSE